MFTKGPWVIVRSHKSRCEITHDGEINIAEAWGIEIPVEEMLANAHLIASAPDQNECLHSVKKTLEHYLERLEYRQTGNDPKTNGFAFAAFPDWELRHTIELINDVLNKAEGKS